MIVVEFLTFRLRRFLQVSPTSLASPALVSRKCRATGGSLVAPSIAREKTGALVFVGVGECPQFSYDPWKALPINCSTPSKELPGVIEKTTT